MQLRQLEQTFESLWPISSAEAWDKPGLMSGSRSQKVSKVLLSVDVTAAALREAKELGCNLILSHHPMFLRGVHSLDGDGFRGANLEFAIRSGIAIYSAHTNADFQTDGVTQTLAKALGLSNFTTLDSTNSHVLVGELNDSISLLEFARSVARALPAVAAGVKVSGDPAKSISKVAVLAGAGDGYLSEVQLSGVDVYVTSDLRHHPAQDFMEQSNLSAGPALIDISHWGAEWLWLQSAREQLQTIHPELEFVVSDTNTDPWTFAVMQ